MPDKISYFCKGYFCNYCILLFPFKEVYIDSLKCQIKCEENLMPNVGGYYVENFVSTIYHYLQYAYYKCKFSTGWANKLFYLRFMFCSLKPISVILCTVNDGRRAVPCAYSYFLFQPEDPVMKDNLLYYKAYSQQWGLQSHHFTPRTVRGTSSKITNT